MMRLRTAGCGAILTAAGWISIVTTSAGAWTDESTMHRSEWRASTFTRSTQSEAAIDVDARGNLTVVWSSRRQQGGRYGVYAQRFTADGIAIGSETQVNLWTESHQRAPAIDGQWIVWQSHGQDGDAGAIVARLFTDGLDGSSEILVNQHATGEQVRPIVAVSPGGTAVIAWMSSDHADDQPDIRFRLFGTDGQPCTDELRLEVPRGHAASTPALAWADDDQFAVAIATLDAGMRPAGIALQRFDATGTSLGAPTFVCDQQDTRPIEPIIQSLDGHYLVTWLDAVSDGDSYGVRARRVDFAGCAIDDDAFTVNADHRGTQNGVAIAVDHAGRIAIAYNSPDSDGVGISARLYDRHATPLGREIRLTGHEEGSQRLHQVMATKRLVFGLDGRLYAAWYGDGGCGDSSAVHVTMLSEQPVMIAGVPGVTADMKPALTAGADMAISGAMPHQPPTFDPKAVEDVVVDVRRGARGIDFLGFPNTGWTPPDPQMAVGPNHIVAIVNGGIRFFQKDGTLDFSDQIEGAGGFWGGLGATGFVFDPEAVWDGLANRFWVMAAESISGSQSFVLVAVSDDDDPNGTWHKYRFDTTSLAGDLFDSPNIGVDASVLYITGDGFGLGANYPVYTYDKASLLVGNPPAITRSTTLATSTQSAGIPEVSYDSPPALYMIEHKESVSNTQVRLIALQDPLGTPTFTTTNLTVPSYGRPEDPPQMGSTTSPESFDARFWSAMYRNGKLWATHHINSSRVVARWYEIDMNGWPTSGNQPFLVQSGDIDLGATIRTFFCAINVDVLGNAAMTYARSSPTEFISMETVFRFRTDPLGTFQAPVRISDSTGANPSDRWGDYSAVQFDPADPRTFWAHHERTGGAGWRTRIGGVDLPCTPPDVVCDGVVNADDFLAVLAAWGPCPGCPADVTGDNVVDTDDFLAILANWG